MNECDIFVGLWRVLKSWHFVCCFHFVLLVSIDFDWFEERTFRKRESRVANRMLFRVGDSHEASVANRMLFRVGDMQRFWVCSFHLVSTESRL